MTMFIMVSSWPQVIVRVHSVHLMNVDQRQAAADPQTKPSDLGYESACFRQLASTTNIAIYYYKCKKNCSLSTTYNGEMTHRKQQK